MFSYKDRDKIEESPGFACVLLAPPLLPDLCVCLCANSLSLLFLLVLLLPLLLFLRLTSCELRVLKRSIEVLCVIFRIEFALNFEGKLLYSYFHLKIHIYF